MIYNRLTKKKLQRNLKSNKIENRKNIRNE